MKAEKATLLADLKSTFKWTGGADVLKTWKKHGFVPPSEHREDYLFKLNRDANTPTERGVYE